MPPEILPEVHLQEQPQLWSKVSDEEHLQALLEAPRLVDSLWIAYLNHERPQVFQRFLRLYRRLA